MSSKPPYGFNGPQRNHGGYNSNKNYQNKGYGGGSGRNSSSSYTQHNQSSNSDRNYNKRPNSSHQQYNQQNRNNSSYRARSNLYQQYSSQPQHHHQQQQDNQFQIWMGDIDPTWDEHTIEATWTNLVTKPKSIKLMRDRVNPSNSSYCFVTFPDKESYELALQRNNQPVPNSTKFFKLNSANNSKQNQGKSNTSIGGEFSIFVGDLSQEVNEHMLFTKFNLKYPNQVKQVKVIIDPNTNVGKGFGFVKFLNGEIMQKALKEMQGVMVGSKPIRVGVAAGSENPQTSSIGIDHKSTDFKKLHLPQHQPNEINPQTDENNTCITINGLSSKFTEQELQSYFIAFGDLIYVKISKNFQTGYIKFLLRSSAESAMLYLNGLVINECRLKLNWGSSNILAQEENGLNFEPNYELTKYNYTKQQQPPRFYHSIDYTNTNISSLRDEAIQQYANRLDETEIISVNQINEIYLNSKMCRN
ncbi:hypothetical protein KGF54_003233 [Candida jiufengensis]|uniref:uncharacterized protein n=1 Tax=Candida jiufengensis TaxID=497108 RepID=UPI002225A5B3|nr:uncharacterized protein KGF54_003233 [Candida jiufengensis]KAI5952367.1 hypothetical protein KGF54_003233 [Candida jiufengensis]